MIRNNKRRSACIVAHGTYPASRKYREAMALCDAGYNVDVICIKRNRKESRMEMYDDVNIFRLPIVKKRKTQLRYIVDYTIFFLLCSVRLTQLYLKKKYSLVQVHSMPEFLVFTTLLPKLFGSKVILDVQDPSREVYISKYGHKGKDFILKIIEVQERLSFLYSDRLITPNIGFRKKFMERGLDEEKMGIVMNTPDSRIFKKELLKDKLKNKKEGKFILLFHGTIVERHGLDIVVEALCKLVEKISEVQLEVAGGGEQLEHVKGMVNRLGLEKHVIFHNQVDQKKIPELIIRSDIGIIPNRLDAFTNINLPQRIFEFAIYDVPVVIARTSGVQDYFDENCMAFFRPEDADDLTAKIYELYKDPEKRKRIAFNTRKVSEELKWDVMKMKYLEIIKRLC